MADATNEKKIAMYRDAVMTARACAMMLAQHDIKQLLADIATADTLGPILDPTLWRDKRKAMEEDAEVLRAALALQKYAVK